MTLTDQTRLLPIENRVFLLSDATATYDHDCARCGEVFALVRRTDDDGNDSFTGGVLVDGQWTCDECKLDGVWDWAFDLETNRHPANPNFQALTSKQVEDLELDELAAQGWLYSSADADEEPDTDPGDIPEQGLDAEWS